MPKQREGWERGEGPFSSSKDLGLTQGKPDSTVEKDISAIVEKNQESSGALDASKSKSRK